MAHLPIYYYFFVIMSKVPMTFDASMMQDLEAGQGQASPFSELATLKVYNPKVGEKPDPELVGKFRLITSDKVEHIIDAPVEVNILDYAYFFSGEFFQETPEGPKKVYAYTNEFGPYHKNIDPISFIIDGQHIGSFEKGKFTQMIRTKKLNGQENYFYDKKKKSDGTPYDGSLIERRAVMYGEIISGDFAGTLFRMYVSVPRIGKTYVDGKAVSAVEGTLLAAVEAGLPDMKAQNSKISRITPRHVDLSFGIRLNDKNNCLLDASYKGLTGFRTNNSAQYEKIQSMRKEAFGKYDNTPITPILLDNPDSPTDVKVNLTPTMISAPSSIESTIQKQNQILDARATFDSDEVHIDEVPW